MRKLLLSSFLLILQGCLTSSSPLEPVRGTAAQALMAGDFLVQDVCVTPGGQVLAIDPYDCPPGGRLRDLAIGEPLPYHKHDQPDADHPEGFQRHDSYPLRGRTGQLIVMNPFDYEPFAHFDPARDGYDLYTVREGWASVGETRDGGGYTTTFYGAGCRRYNGWIFFDTASLTADAITDGSFHAPIAGNYWEQNGQDWPGDCPAAYAGHDLTRWEWIKGLAYGGVNGNRVKVLDTIRSIHGYSDSAAFRAKGHLEVFYFTRLYGITRWETWVPDEQFDANDAALKNRIERASRFCNGSSQLHYEDHDFTRTACRDWSAVTPAAAPETVTPWPLPELNLLRNFHFGADLSAWTLAGTSTDGHPLTGQLRNSKTEMDRRHARQDGKGLRYLTLDCGGRCSDDESLYQDVTLAPEITSGEYSLGITIRTEHEHGAVRISLQQLDGQGSVLDEHSFEDGVEAQNPPFSGEQSILKSSRFIAHTQMLTLDPRAHHLRLRIAPLTADTYDLIDAWLMKRTY